ncbi:phage integrase N-terminal SAM-like domain-containing protein [Comamonas granuli]|uniref:phage integrase N-terminal SAM-like domain-containing protein n=1 Tax=Comamonas granuli TaxID=290309 RepID=UPI001FE0DA61|nr:phage integrase N-terminal SAM-like domain-containing protein [Comamonas granuli]
MSHLAVDRQVAASTQNQAKSAILYLYKQVLGMELPWLNEVIQAKRPRRLPVVLTPSEVRELLMHMEGTAGLVAQLLYGTGLGLMSAGLAAQEPLYPCPPLPPVLEKGWQS